jgi:hypothetical protein
MRTSSSTKLQEQFREAFLQRVNAYLPEELLFIIKFFTRP